MVNQNQNRLLLPWTMLLLGFSAVVAQVTLVRELIVEFRGNELTLGVMLAGWLLWTAAGSGLAGRLVTGVNRPGPVVAALQAGAAVVFPLTLLVVRCTGPVTGLAPGEIAGPGPMFLVSFTAVGPFCLISGALFAVAGRLHATERGTGVAEATSGVYFFESVGAVAGGLAASLVFQAWFTPFSTALVITWLNLLTATVLFTSHGGRRTRAVVVVAALAAASVLPGTGGALERLSLQYRWRGFDVEEVAYSVYGNLVLTATRSSRTIFENGVPLVTCPDPESAQESAHLALLQHPSPSRVLLVGGGAGGTLEEVLKHAGVRRVDYVELDPAVLRLSRACASVGVTLSGDSSRVAIHTDVDGRLFIKRTRQSYDVVLVNLPDPTNSAINRFYTEEFFREVDRVLAPGGVFSFRVTGAENFIGSDLEAFLRCIHLTLASVFPRIVVFPGATIRFFAGGRAAPLTENAEVLLDRMNRRGVETTYVGDVQLPFRLSPDRLEDIRRVTSPAPGTPVNSDFAPVAYYFSNVLWSTRFRERAGGFLRIPGRVGFGRFMYLLGGLLLLVTCVTLMVCRGRRLVAAAVAGSTAATGFTMIGLQVLLLLSFQAVYGYVYHQLALLVAAFMAGLAAGSRLALSRVGRSDRRTRVRALVTAQLFAAVLPGACVVAARAVAGYPGAAGTVSAFGLFPAMALVSGAAGGFQFAVASHLWFGDKRGISRNPGTVYALDITGAFAGAALLSAYMLPVFGFVETSIVLACVNAVPAVLLLRAA